MSVRAKVYIVLFFVLSVCRLNAQTFVFKNYSTNQGLPSSETYNSIQDEQGYMWFATDRGVAKFDGYSFKTLTTNEGLTDNTVFEFFKDNKQQVWCKTFSSTISRISNDSAYPYKYNHIMQRTLPSEILKGNLFDKNGNLLFVKENENKYDIIFKLDKNGRLDTINKMYNNGAKQLFIVGEGPCLFGGNIYEPQTDIFFLDGGEKIASIKYDGYYKEVFSKKLKNNSYALLANRNIYIIKKNRGIEELRKGKGVVLYFFVDKDENFWVGYRGKGFEFISAKSGYTEVITGLGNLSPSSINQDREGGMWLTTLEKGIFYLAPSAPLAYNKENGLSSEKINKIVNVEGNIVLITPDGEMLLKKQNSNAFNILTSKSSGANDLVYSKENGIFYFSPTDDPILKNSKHTEVPFHKKIVIGKKYLWTFFYREISKYTLQGKKINKIIFNEKRIQCIEELDNGDVLVGTLGGLYIYKNDSVTPLSVYNPLFNLRVSDIKQIDKNHVVIATIGGGIILAQINNYANIIQYKTENGLPSVMCNVLLKYNDSILWVGTNRGLCRIKNILPGNKIKFNKTDINDGLISNEVNDICLIDDKLWVATAEGLSVLSQNRDETNIKNALIYIKKININGEEAPLQPLTKLAYNKNNIAFSFIGLNYQYAGKLVYKYRLVGADAKWNTTTNLSVVYNTLPSGKYTFEIGVVNPNGSNPVNFAQYSFTILPPFWQTAWFLILVIAVLALLIYWYIRYRVNFVRKQQQLNIDLNTFRDRALRGQMNPHFIYNSLNSIQNYMLKSDTMASVSFLSKFSQLMRLTFNNTAQELITLEKDVEALLLYIELEDLRFQHKFVVHIENSTNIDFAFIKVPPLILQPFVENAIQHGLLTKTAEGNIWISFIKHPDSLEITILDDGIGRANAKKIQERKARFKARLSNAFGKREYTGITATQTRIQQAWGKKFSKNHFKIVDLYTDNGVPKGTLIHIFLPIYD